MIHEKYKDIAPETYNFVKRLSRNTPEMTIKELYEKLTGGDTDGDMVGAADLLEEILAENKSATDSKKTKEFVKAYEAKVEKSVADTAHCVVKAKESEEKVTKEEKAFVEQTAALKRIQQKANDKAEAEKPISPKEAKEKLLAYADGHTIVSADIPKLGDPVATTPIPSEGQLAIQKEFGRKRIELKARINKLEELIALYTKQKKEAEEQIQMLDKTAMLFGMKPTKEFNCGSQEKQTL